MFSVMALQLFKLGPEQNGYLMAYLGIVQMVGVTKTVAHVLVVVAVVGVRL